jgi:hypothetical protein
MGETENVMSFPLEVQAINISLIGVFEFASIQIFVTGIAISSLALL